MKTPLKREDVTFTIKIDPCLDKPDDNFDPETVEWINKELNKGNDWAWFDATVIAEYKGFVGKQHLGCNSYDSEAAFKDDSYYKDMQQDAFDDLIKTIDKVIDNVLTLFPKDVEAVCHGICCCNSCAGNRTDFCKE